MAESTDRWLQLTTAPDQLTAEMWLQVLHQHGIPVVINPGDISSFLGVSPFPCRLMVAGDYLEQAREILAALKPEEEPGEGGKGEKGVVDE